MAPFLSLPLGEAFDPRSLPKTPAVIEFLGEGEKSLLIGRPRNLQRFVASHLGLGPKPKPGQRPPLNLRPVAVALRYRLAPSPFEQRLVYERLMAPLVPRSARRDLKDPFYLRLDPAARFPRVEVHSDSRRDAFCYGPFRTRPAAQAAVRELQRKFSLRPCDYVFEPQAELPLGLSCLFAQTRTCPAPCLCRIGEEPYRLLGQEAAAFLARGGDRPELPWLPPFVTFFPGSRGLVVIPRGETIALYPTREGSVLDECAREVALEDLLEAKLEWRDTDHAPNDGPWLTEWLYTRKREGFFLLAGELASCLERALSLAAAQR